MDASQYLRAKKACMSQYLSRSSCADAGLRTWTLQHAANRYYANPNAPESVAVQQCAVATNSNNAQLMITRPPEAHIGFGGNTTVAVPPIQGASCTSCDSLATFYLPPMVIPGQDVVYMSSNYLAPCTFVPFQGTAGTVGQISSCCGVFQFGQLNQG
jgi:hypothetical protein